MLENNSYFNILYNFTYLKKWLKSLKKCSTSFNEFIVFFLQVLKFNFFFFGGEGFFGGGYGFGLWGGGGGIGFSHLYKVGI